MANPNDIKNKDAGDPRTSGSPEQFLQDAPAHLAAQGDKAPPMPNAKPARRFFRLHDKGGMLVATGPADKDGRVPRTMRTAGSVFPMDHAIAAQHPELTEVDEAGQPLQTRGGDRLGDRETTEATGAFKR